MAFQNVQFQNLTTSEPVKLTAMKVGASVVGYCLGFIPSKQNPDNSNIIMREENGSGTFYIYTAGNVKYLVRDGKVKKGLLTKITRIEDKMVKGKKSSQFNVEQDPEQTLEDVAFAAITSTTELSSAGSDRAAALLNVKVQADKLKAAAAGRK